MNIFFRLKANGRMPIEDFGVHHRSPNHEHLYQRHPQAIINSWSACSRRHGYPQYDDSFRVFGGPQHDLPEKRLLRRKNCLHRASHPRAAHYPHPIHLGLDQCHDLLRGHRDHTRDHGHHHHDQLCMRGLRGP